MPQVPIIQAWEFILIEDKKMIQKLADMKIHSQFAETASAIIVICSEEFRYWIQDASIVVAHVYLEATNQGLGTCCIEVFDSKTYDNTDAEEYIREALSIPKEIRILAMMPVGYPDPKLQPSAHTDSEFKTEKIHNEKW